MLSHLFNRKSAAYKQERQALLNSFSQCALGLRMLEWAEDNGVKIRVCDLPDDRLGEFNAGNNRINISPWLSNGKAMEALAHELRHAWQYQQAPKLWRYAQENPFAAPFFTRLIEADAYSFGQFYNAARFPNTAVHDADNISRRKWFDDFFAPTFVNRHKYDADMAAPEMIYSAVMWQYFDRFIRFKSRPFQISEADFDFLGKSAWGECNGQDYLHPETGKFKMQQKYTDAFNAQGLLRLGQLRCKKTLNILTLRNGEKRPIFPV